MTRYNFWIFFLLLSFTLKAQTDTTVIYMDRNWQPCAKGEAKYYRQVYKKDSVWMMNDYFISGKLQMRGSYLDDKLSITHGEFEFFYESGQKSKIQTFNKNKLQGVSMSWFENGNIDYRISYKTDGSRKCTYYHENGQLSALEEYINDSVLVKAEMWDEDGKVSENREIYREAEFPGGEEGLTEYFAKKMYYPTDENGVSITGKVKFVIEVSKEGKAIWGGVIGFVHPYAALAIEDLVKKMPAWTPAKMHNRIVVYRARQVFNFQ